MSDLRIRQLERAAVLDPSAERALIDLRIRLGSRDPRLLPRRGDVVESEYGDEREVLAFVDRETDKGALGEVKWRWGSMFSSDSIFWWRVWAMGGSVLRVGP